MSARREQSEELDPGRLTPVADPGVTAPDGTPLQAVPDETPVHTAPHEDRWHWRSKIRANPHQRRIYRAVVALVGLLIIVFGLLTGPLPGPGGIPLVLLGLAVLASEFVWAHRVMSQFKVLLHRFQGWTRWQQTGFWVAFIAFCGLCGYSFMVLTGVPAWVPQSADDLLEQLPGL